MIDFNQIQQQMAQRQQQMQQQVGHPPGPQNMYGATPQAMGQASGHMSPQMWAMNQGRMGQGMGMQQPGQTQSMAHSSPYMPQMGQRTGMPGGMPTGGTSAPGGWGSMVGAVMGMQHPQGGMRPPAPPIQPGQMPNAPRSFGVMPGAWGAVTGGQPPQGGMQPRSFGSMAGAAMGLAGR